MDKDNQQRRVKVTGAAAHRKGEKRAAVKPHKTTGSAASPQPSAAKSVDVKRLISEFMSSLTNVNLSQSAWGDPLKSVASVLQNNYGLAPNDEVYLLNDPTGTSRGQAGLLLSTSGIHLSDGKGALLAIPWKDLKGQTVAWQQGMLVIGQNAIKTSDGQVLAALLQHVQSKLV